MIKIYLNINMFQLTIKTTTGKMELISPITDQEQDLSIYYIETKRVAIKYKKDVAGTIYHKNSNYMKIY